jgi:hypothetical protein
VRKQDIFHRNVSAVLAHFLGFCNSHEINKSNTQFIYFPYPLARKRKSLAQMQNTALIVSSRQVVKSIRAKENDIIINGAGDARIYFLAVK